VQARNAHPVRSGRAAPPAATRSRGRQAAQGCRSPIRFARLERERIAPLRTGVLRHRRVLCTRRLTTYDLHNEIESVVEHGASFRIEEPCCAMTFQRTVKCG
jgi:hypothetical protein